MTESFHTIVIGGGCLGCSTAIALARRLGTSHGVCLLEKSIVGAGVSSRQGGVVQAVDMLFESSRLAVEATLAWRNIDSLWGVQLPLETRSVLWLVPNSPAVKTRWQAADEPLSAAGVEIHPLRRAELTELTGQGIGFHDDELGFLEPDALALDPTRVLQGMLQALRGNGVTLRERTEVTGFDTDANGRITAVVTNRGKLHCEFVVNAVGGWSPKVFAPLKLSIPVALVPTYIAQWRVGSTEVREHAPIIADYVNRAYFRLWPGGLIRMHQPRDRRSAAIARTFSGDRTSAASPDIITEPSNYFTHHGLLRPYREKLRHRFPKVEQPIFAGGFVSYFDITPDLRFILGADHRIENLVHCLGAGMGFTFAPLFGRLLSEFILESRVPEALQAFSIRRFHDRSLEEFWGLNEQLPDAGSLRETDSRTPD